jgi:peptidoglycan/xylan/chitin deacetylase (PgdA/CDA1 family)
VINELKQNEDLIHSISGKKVRLFRPPFGVTNPNIAAAARLLEYKVIGWSIRSLDTMGKPDGKIIKRVVSRFKPGSLILLHDTHAGTANILTEVIKQAKEDGYTFVRPDELFNLEAYK